MSLGHSVTSFGVICKDVKSRDTDPVGVMIEEVEQSSPASRAGLKPGDIITSVASLPTAHLQQFGEAVSQAQGTFGLTINRDGRRNVPVTVHA